MPGMMKNRAAGYKYGGAASKPKKKKIAMGGAAKKATPMKHGGMKSGLYKMGKGGYTKATQKDMMKAGGERLMKSLAKKFGYKVSK
tara:strand:+ start:325 stop:582 length:258 start_codon:yes stop_codon:yes gene_type:complete